MRIIVGRHGESVGASAHDCEQITPLGPRDFAILGEEITALADRPHDVGDDLLRLVIYHGLNRLVRAVERRADEIVHATVHDHKFFGTRFL